MSPVLVLFYLLALFSLYQLHSKAGFSQAPGNSRSTSSLLYVPQKETFLILPQNPRIKLSRLTWVTHLLFFFLNKFIYFIFGCVGSSLLHVGFYLVVAREGYSLLPCASFSLRWLLLLQSTGSRHVGFSSCGTRAQ